MTPIHALFSEVETVLARHQPELKSTLSAAGITIEGAFVCISDDGPFDHFEVKLEITSSFPLKEPKLWEVAGRIPHTRQRHVYSDGSCCLGLWEAWLLKTSVADFEQYLLGPVSSYFVSQFMYETTGEWPFGEQGHSLTDVAATYGEALDLPAGTDLVAYFKLLSAPLLTGNPPCPCGSGNRLRICHWSELRQTRRRVDASVRKKLAKRLMKIAKE